VTKQDQYQPPADSGDGLKDFSHTLLNEQECKERNACKEKQIN
jgi:hypothetical protein